LIGTTQRASALEGRSSQVSRRVGERPPPVVPGNDLPRKQSRQRIYTDFTIDIGVEHVNQRYH
jgi:hypothetical protein